MPCAARVAGRRSTIRPPAIVCTACGQRFPRFGGVPDPSFPPALVCFVVPTTARVVGGGVGADSTRHRTAGERSGRAAARPGAGPWARRGGARAGFGYSRHSRSASHGCDGRRRGRAAREFSLAPQIHSQRVSRLGMAGRNERRKRTRARLDRYRARRTRARANVGLGAGACRLAYDLHRRDAGMETLAVDIDPLLFAVAQAVLRGGTVSLREANAEIDELGHVVTQWKLSAPHGAVDAARFHFLLADGLEPPLAPGASTPY